MIDTKAEFDKTDQELQEFIENYINVSQLLFNLIPLVTYIYEDPYLDKSAECTKFIQDYLLVAKLVE